MSATDSRRYWLTATHGAITSREWFTVIEDPITHALFGGDLDKQAQADGAFQVLRLAGEGGTIGNAFQRGEIVLTTDDGRELARMEAKP